jgi:hypothetical protein
VLAAGGIQPRDLRRLGRRGRWRRDWGDSGHSDGRT